MTQQYIGIVTAIDAVGRQIDSRGHIEVNDGSLTVTFEPPLFTKGAWLEKFGDRFHVLEFEGDLLRKIQVDLPRGK
jgi:hypothetical protein